MAFKGLSKVAVFVHLVLVLVAVHYVTRIVNFTPASRLPSGDMLAFSATALPPLLAGWIGIWLARNARAAGLLAIGLWLGAAIYAASLVGVMASREPLAPLWLIFVSLGLAAGYAVLLAGVWLIGCRRG